MGDFNNFDTKYIYTLVIVDIHMGFMRFFTKNIISKELNI